MYQFMTAIVDLASDITIYLLKHWFFMMGKLDFFI